MCETSSDPVFMDDVLLHRVSTQCRIDDISAVIDPPLMIPTVPICIPNPITLGEVAGNASGSISNLVNCNLSNFLLTFTAPSPISSITNIPLCRNFTISGTAQLMPDCELSVTNIEVTVPGQDPIAFPDATCVCEMVVP